MRFIDGQYFGVLAVVQGSGSLAGTDPINRASGFKLDYLTPGETSFSLYTNTGIDRIGVWDLQDTELNFLPVPEPGSLSLLALGLLAAIGMFRFFPGRRSA